MNSNYDQTVKLWDEITETLSKLSLIAAGTISLSITFLGYVLSIGISARHILREPLIGGIPAIDILFLSWILLFLSVLLGIVIRIPNAWYLFNAHVHLWFKDLAEKTQNGDEKNYQFVSDSAKTGQDKYRTISRFVRWGTIASFALGILALIIFVIVVANGLVNI